MGLFLEGIFNKENYSPCAINIEYPIVGGTWDTMTGLLVSEPTMSTAINWGPILNDLSNIQDISSLIGASQMWTWIGASAMCWKGTSPLKTSVEFFLINYKPGLGLENQLRFLNYLTCLQRKKGDEKIAVQVHGGYTAPVLQSNQDFMNNNVSDKKKFIEEAEGSLASWGKSVIENYVFKPNSKIDMETGTIRIRFGRKMTISHLLIQKLDVTPSIVEVPDGKPLYYRVSMSLTGSRPLLQGDVDEMYNVGY